MNVVDLNGSSLVDYVLHSRICLLERLLGVELYGLIFGDRVSDDVHDTSEVPFTGYGRSKTRITSLSKTSTYIYSDAKSVNLSLKKMSLRLLDGKLFKPPKYSSRLSLNMYWKAKSQRSNLWHNRRKASDASSACLSVKAASDEMACVGLRERLHSSETSNDVKPQESETDLSKSLSSSIFSHCAADFKRVSLPPMKSNGINSKVSKPKFLKGLSTPVFSHCINSADDSESASRHLANQCKRRTPFVRNAERNHAQMFDTTLANKGRGQGALQNRKLGFSKSEVLGKSRRTAIRASDVKMPCSATHSAMLLDKHISNSGRKQRSPHKLSKRKQLSQPVDKYFDGERNRKEIEKNGIGDADSHLPAGDSVSASVQRKNISQTLIGKSGTKECAGMPQECRKSSIQPKKELINKNVTSRCLDKISDSNDDVSSYFEELERSGRLLDTAPVTTESFDSSSYRFMRDHSVPSSTFEVVPRTLSDISLPSINNGKHKPGLLKIIKATVLSTQQSVQDVARVIPPNNVNVKARKFLRATSIVNSLDTKRDTIKVSLRTKDVSRFPSTKVQSSTDTALKTEDMLKPGRQESQISPRQQTGSTSTSSHSHQQQSMPMVDNPSSFVLRQNNHSKDQSNYSNQSKYLIDRPSAFIGQPSAMTSSINAKRLTDYQSMFASTGRETLPAVNLQLSSVGDKLLAERTPKLQRGLNAKDLDHCGTCGLGLLKLPHATTTFFNLTLILLTFAETNKNHSSTITKVVDSSRSIYGVVQIIKRELDIASNTIRIYADKTRRVQLPYEKTLEDCGYHGKAEWYQPTDLTLYYDYDCDYFDCPILVSDYYFINRKRQATTTN